MIRRPPRSTLDRSSAASDVYKRQAKMKIVKGEDEKILRTVCAEVKKFDGSLKRLVQGLSLIHISEPTRPY